MSRSIFSLLQSKALLRVATKDPVSRRLAMLHSPTTREGKKGYEMERFITIIMLGKSCNGAYYVKP